MVMRVILLFVYTAHALVSRTGSRLEDVISQWDYQQRGSVDPAILPAVKKGLLLIDRLCGNDNDDRRQECMAILMKALRNHDGKNFEEYISTEMEQQITASSDTTISKSALQLPKNVQTVVSEAVRLRRLEPQMTLTEISTTLKIPRRQLVEYLRLSRTSLSFESTVEIKNPIVDYVPSFQDQDEFEKGQGWHLDTGRGVQREENVQEFLDETIEHEGDDEAWMQQETIASRLMDAIPDDTEDDILEREDSIILEELLRSNLSRVLSSTLKPQQLMILKYIYGLETGEAMEVDAVAKHLGMAPERVASLLQSAVARLRQAYAEKYLNTYSMEEESI